MMLSVSLAMHTLNGQTLQKSPAECVSALIPDARQKCRYSVRQMMGYRTRLIILLSRENQFNDIYSKVYS